VLGPGSLSAYDPDKNQLDHRNRLNAEGGSPVFRSPCRRLNNVGPEVPASVGHDLTLRSGTPSPNSRARRRVRPSSPTVPCRARTDEPWPRPFPKHRVLFQPRVPDRGHPPTTDMRHPDRQIIGYTTDDSFPASPRTLMAAPAAPRPSRRIMPAPGRRDGSKYYGQHWFSRPRSVFAKPRLYDSARKLGVDYDGP